MHNLLRYIRMNKSKLIKVALIVAFLIIILQVLNYISGNKNNIEFSNDSSNIQKETNGTIKSDKSAITGKKVSTNEIKAVGNVINEFVNYCNQKEIEKAYDLLSQQCKDILYSDINYFESDYCNKIFKGETRKYTVQNWSGDTYIVKFTEDLLATGKSGSNSSFTDYITIVEENNEKRININSLIGKKEINKESEKDSIKIKVLNEIQYMEYAIYEIEATNNNNDIIELTQNTPSIKGIYLKDTSDTKHYSYINEIVEDDLKVQPKLTKKIKIKFDSPYISGRKINKFCLSNITLYYSIEYRTARIVDITVNL